MSLDEVERIRVRGLPKLPGSGFLFGEKPSSIDAGIYGFTRGLIVAL
jgi:hypothetical protein